MRSNLIHVVVSGVAVVAIGIYAERSSGTTIASKNDEVAGAVERGAKWLVSVQGKDGGWGQDGGETSYVRKGEQLESNGNDVANTAGSRVCRAGCASKQGDTDEHRGPPCCPSSTM